MPRNTQAMDMLIQLMPQLRDKEKDALRKFLGPIDPCRENGHKFKVMRAVKQWWWWMPPKVELFCEKCGKTMIK